MQNCEKILFGVLRFSILGRTYSIFGFENLGKIVVIRDTAFYGDIVDWIIGGGQQRASIGKSACFDITGRSTLKAFITDVVDLVAGKVKFRAED